MEVIITIGIAIIAVSLTAWLISSYRQFKKMDENPDDFKERRTFKSVSDGSEEL